MWAGGCIPNPAVTTQINNAYNATATRRRRRRRLSCQLTQQQKKGQQQQQQQRWCYYFAYPKFNPPSPIPSPTSLARRCSSAEQVPPQQDNINNNNHDHLPLTQQYQPSQNKGLWKQWREKSADMSSMIAKLGLSAVLAYGLFDAMTYTSFFVLAFLGYEKSTGQNPAANLKALIGIVILMWTGNNVTRPIRVAGAAALAPIIDKGLKKIQKYFNFPSLFHAFALVVGVVATPCLMVVSVLVLSRWGK